MYQHMLIVYNNSKSSKRIALHKYYEDLSDSIEIKDIIKELKKNFSSSHFSFYHVFTEKKSIDSIEEHDPFFRGIFYFSDIKKFTTRVTEESRKIIIERLREKYPSANFMFQDSVEFLSLVFTDDKLNGNEKFFDYAYNIASQYLKKKDLERFSVVYDYFKEVP